MAENTAEKKFLYGFGNKVSTVALSQGAVQDPLPSVLNGMNALKEEGFNGKGEWKEYGANPLEETSLIGNVVGSGNAIVVAKHSTDAKKFVVKSPLEENTSYHIVYDMRVKDKPLAIFKKQYIKNDKGEWEKTEQKLNESELVLVKKGDYELQEVAVVAQALAKALAQIDSGSKTRIVEELKAQKLVEDGKLNLKNTEDMFKFIKAYDLMEKTEENIKAIRSAVVVDAEVAIKKDDLKRLSEIYNPMTLHGIKIGSYSEAMIISALLRGEIEEEKMDMVEKAFVEYNKSLESGFDMIELIEADQTFGVDADNNIVLIEDSNVPYQSGGAIHEMAIANLVAEAKKARGVINGAFWEQANKIDPEKYPRNEDSKSYSEAEILKAEKTLTAEAEKWVSVLGETAQKHLETILGNAEPITSMLTSGNIEKAQKAQKLAQGLEAIVRNGAIKKAISDDPMLLVKNGYFKDGRQIGQANSSPKTLMKYDFKEGERMVMVSTDIPKLIKTVGDDAVVNFKTTKMPVMQIVVDKDGEVKDLQPVNTFGVWTKQQSLGRILSTIMKLDPSDEKLQQKFKNLINYGGKLNDRDTKFGLGAVLQDENNQLAQYYKPFISELRSMAYPDGKEKFDGEALQAIQDKIGDLVNSEDYSLQNLGKQVIALQKRDETLQGYFNKAGINALRSRKQDDQSVEKREHLKTMLIDVLNGKKAEPITGLELSVANTGAVIKEYIKGVRHGADETMVKVAAKMGFEHDDAKQGMVIKTNKDGEPYIKTGFYDEHLYGGKELKEIKEKFANSMPPFIDTEAIKAEIAENKAYYEENKVVYNNRKSLYSEEADVSVKIEMEIDDPELKAALEGAMGAVEEEQPQEVVSQEDEIAEAQEMGDTPEAAEGIVVNLDGIDPALFDDGFDPEEEATQEEKQAEEMAKAISVNF